MQNLASKILLNAWNKLLANPLDLAIYLGIPLFITIILYLLWQIRKSLVRSPQHKKKKSDDELI